MKTFLKLAVACALVSLCILVALGWPHTERVALSLPEQGVEVRVRLSAFGDGALLCFRNGQQIGRVPIAPAEYGETLGDVVWLEGAGLKVTILNYRGSGEARAFVVPQRLD